jgi:hypothetical protein
MLTDVHGTSWEAINCPECSINNWVCHGNLEDVTQPDRDGCKCWNCGAKWLFWPEEIVGEPHYIDGESWCSGVFTQT